MLPIAVTFSLSEVHLPQSFPILLAGFDAMSLHPVEDAVGDAQMHAVDGVHVIPEGIAETHIYEIGKHLLGMVGHVAEILRVTTLDFRNVNLGVPSEYLAMGFVLWPPLNKQLNQIVLGTPIGKANYAFFVAELMDEPLAQMRFEIKLDCHGLVSLVIVKRREACAISPRQRFLARLLAERTAKIVHFG